MKVRHDGTILPPKVIVTNLKMMGFDSFEFLKFETLNLVPVNPRKVNNR